VAASSTPIGNEVDLNGATAVTVIAAPGAGAQRIVFKDGASVFNLDSVPHDITWQKNKGGTITVLQKTLAVAAGLANTLAKVVVLDATNESLEAKIEGAHTTIAPRADAAAMETTS
jgi:hypothetical protein